MKNDLELLQGTWNIQSLELDGYTMTGASLAGGSIEVSGETFISRGMGAVYEGTIGIDSAAAPKAFDFTFNAGPEKGNVNAGIYELEADTWRICLNTKGGDRPREFSAPSGTGLALEVLRRKTDPSFNPRDKSA